MAEAMKSANSARPGSLGSPIPNGADAEAAALDAFLAKSPPPAAPAAPPAAAGNTEAAALNDFMAKSAEAEAPPQGAVMKTLDGAGRVLDYPGGFVRAGLAADAGLLTGNPNLVTTEDLKKAAVGKGPNSAEYLRRLGVPEGGTFNFMGAKVSTRDVEGLALDVATDPLTAVAKLVKGAPYIAKLLSLPGKATEALGEAVYRSGLAKVDAKLVGKGAEKVSSVLLEEGAPIGTASGLAAKVENMANTMGKVRQGLYDKATELGVSIDAGYPLKRAEAVLEKMKRNPALVAATEDLQKMLDSYKASGKVSLEQMSEWKTALYDSLPASAFNGQKLRGQAKMFKAALANDFREAIVGAGNAAEKGLGDAIEHTNQKWGTLIEAVNPMKKAAVNGGSKLGTEIDGALLASGHGYAYIGKKAAGLLSTTGAKTTIGRAAMEVGKTDLMNRLVRQGVAGATRPAPLLPEEGE
jgi:hypothetical protein